MLYFHLILGSALHLLSSCLRLLSRGRTFHVHYLPPIPTPPLAPRLAAARAKTWPTSCAAVWPRWSLASTSRLPRWRPRALCALPRGGALMRAADSRPPRWRAATYSQASSAAAAAALAKVHHPLRLPSRNPLPSLRMRLWIRPRPKERVSFLAARRNSTSCSIAKLSTVSTMSGLPRFPRQRPRSLHCPTTSRIAFPLHLLADILGSFE